jgi:hypothetical protein
MDFKGGHVLIIGIFGMNGKELKSQHISSNTQLSAGFVIVSHIY